MIKRFQIEDLIVQDSSGVVFRALDTETDKIVAVRRFFPFGADGGGLQPEEQTAYNIALDRLSGLSHPALRSVICGGCDPVDGMPFIATEWIDGGPLQPIIEAQGPLTPDVATELLTQALEVCELLSHVLAEEAVWVDTGLDTIVFGDEGSGRRFTFWISPLKWLGTGEEPRGLESIITLTEEIMGWKGRNVGDEEGRGLGVWLKWLRGAAATTSLHEARESLAASIGAEPPTPAKKLVTRAVVPPKPHKKTRAFKKSSPKTMLIVNITLFLACAGLGAWVWQRKQKEKLALQMPAAEAAAIPEEAPAPKDSKPLDLTIPDSAPHPPESEGGGLSESERAERASQLAAQLSQSSAPKKPASRPKKAASPPAANSDANKNSDLLTNNLGKEAEVTGVVSSIGLSNSKKTLYLYFAAPSDKSAVRVGVNVSDAPADLSQEALTPLVGQKVHIRGSIQKSVDRQQPDIKIKERSAIQVVK